MIIAIGLLSLFGGRFSFHAWGMLQFFGLIFTSGWDYRWRLRCHYAQHPEDYITVTVEFSAASVRVSSALGGQELIGRLLRAFETPRGILVQAKNGLPLCWLPER